MTKKIFTTAHNAKIMASTLKRMGIAYTWTEDGCQIIFECTEEEAEDAARKAYFTQAGYKRVVYTMVG